MTDLHLGLFPVPIPLQEAIEFLHEAGLAAGIGLGDVLHVRADEDQTRRWLQ